MLRQAVLLLLSASLYFASFPPFSWSLCAWVALVPFFTIVTQVSPRSAAIHGAVWTLLTGYGVAWWCPEMLADYLGLSLLASWAGFLGILLVSASTYYAVFAAWLSWITTRKGTVSPLLVAAGWGVCEFARANLLIGNPWALLGYSQVHQPWLTQIADISSVYGISMVIVAVNACVASIAVPVLRGRSPALSYGGVAVILAAVIGYGQWRLSQSFGIGEPVRIAIIQGGIERQFRWKATHQRENLDRYLSLTKEAMQEHPALIFWPEYAVEFHIQEKSPLGAAVLNLTRGNETNLILGGPHYSFGTTHHRYHNSVFLVRYGRITSRYDKSMLVPFAEEKWFGVAGPGRQPHLEPGRGLSVLRTDNRRLGAFLCFEAMSPSLVRRLTSLGAEILTNPANDDWLGHAIPSQYQLEIAMLRAVENRRYLVRPTSTGYSAVVDPHGRILAHSAFGTAEVVTASIHPVRMQTLYQWWGDAASWAAVLYVMAASLVQWRRTRTR